MMEHTFFRWALAVVCFYGIFMLLWKRFWDTTDPPKPPKGKRDD